MFKVDCMFRTQIRDFIIFTKNSLSIGGYGTDLFTKLSEMFKI